MINRKRTRHLPPQIVLNRNKGVWHDLIRRFVKVDYPIYCFPVEIAERSSEPYEEIERNMELLLEYTEIDNREKLYTTMGIKDMRHLGDNVVDYLRSIGHLAEDNKGRLSLSPLGQDSIRAGEKYKIERSARRLYFDALSLEPLPARYYKGREAAFISLPEERGFRHLNLIDAWEDFSPNKLKSLLRLKGYERHYYNLPQEMLDIKIDKNIFDLSEEEIVSAGVIVYLPLYLQILEDKQRFVHQMESRAIGEFVVYNAYSGRQDDFFLGVIKKNMPRLTYLSAPLFDSLSANFIEEEVDPWRRSTGESIDKRQIRQDDDGNFILPVGWPNVEGWIRDGQEAPLRDVAYNNILPISDLGHRGRVLRLVFSAAVHAKAVKYFINKRVRQLKEQDSSQEFIEREIEKMEKRFF